MVEIMVSFSTWGMEMTTTNEIAVKIAADHSLTKTQSKSIVEAVFTAITSATTSGAETSIPGFGKFKVKDTPEREARNPATGAMIKVAASKKLAFTPAKALKDALNK
jgi:DNA-binding protein HU-beta